MGEPTREPVLLILNTGYERKYYFSAKQAASYLGNLGWWHTHTLPGKGEVQVYRLDNEATEALNRTLKAQRHDHDPRTGKWLKPVLDNFIVVIRNMTGIKEK